MDLIGGLTAAKLALDLARDLRQIDRSVDDAAFKLKLADLTSALADTQVSLAEARTLMVEKDDKIRTLENDLLEAKHGEMCPKCRTHRLVMVSSSGMVMGGLGKYGVEEWKYDCTNTDCDFRTKRVNDPLGLVAKFIAKR